MDNKIEIDGRKSIIINPNLQPAIGLFIEAKYRDKVYPMTQICPIDLSEEELKLVILRFDREDGRVVNSELNHILIMTHLKANNVYRAVGVNHLPDYGRGFRDKIRWYRLGDPQIIVTRGADIAIKSIGTFKRELEELSQNKNELYELIAKGNFLSNPFNYN